ncbi:MAG: hypothetical protein WDZ64_01170 [Parcubacteria group bacterium]
MFGEKQTIVGQFFELAGHEIVGGELTRGDDGDICLWKENTTIEVKSSGRLSSYGFRLHTDQIEKYEKASVFPFDRAWYVFFAYRNRKVLKDGKRKMEFARHKTPIAINRYLASSVLWCTIVDFSIVRQWKEKKVVSTSSVPGHPGDKTVNVKCWEVDSLSNGGFAERLRELDLEPSRFATLAGTICLRMKPDLFNQYYLKFPLNVILPKEETRWAQGVFRRRGIRLKLKQSEI